MKLLLLTLAALFVSVAAIKVRIEYNPPWLKFTMPENGQGELRGVKFHYIIKNVIFTVPGTLTRDGWQYMTDQARLDGADSVQAYAEIHGHNGRVITTEKSILRLNDVATRGPLRLPPRRLRGAVVFRDDFNSLDLSNWRHEISMYGGMNWEFQVYSNDPQNTYVKNGQLYIKPTFTVEDSRFSAPNYLTTGKMDMQTLFGSCTQAASYGCTREGKYGLLPPVMSGKLKSNPTLKFGVVEVRARIPTGDWLWPAIWMLPRDNRYGGWPRSGEIDIMESRGNAGNIGIGSVSSTLHWGPSSGENKFYLTTGAKHTSDWANQFHTWRLEWTHDHIATYIDNKQIMYIDPGSSFWSKGGFGGNNIWSSGEKMAPFDRDFYMIFNVAVGGTNGFFPDNANYVNRKPWKNSSPTGPADFWNSRNEWKHTWQGDKVAMIIDYIEMRNWALPTHMSAQDVVRRMISLS